MGMQGKVDELGAEGKGGREMGMQEKVDELGAEGKGGRDANAREVRRIGG